MTIHDLFLENTRKIGVVFFKCIKGQKDLSKEQVKNWLNIAQKPVAVSEMLTVRSVFLIWGVKS